MSAGCPLVGAGLVPLLGAAQPRRAITCGMKGGTLGYEDEKYSYLVVGSVRTSASARAGARAATAGGEQVLGDAGGVRRGWARAAGRTGGTSRPTRRRSRRRSNAGLGRATARLDAGATASPSHHMVVASYQSVAPSHGTLPRPRLKRSLLRCKRGTQEEARP